MSGGGAVLDAYAGLRHKSGSVRKGVAVAKAGPGEGAFLYGEERLPGILPGGAVVAVRFEEGRFDDAHFSALGIDRPSRLDKAVVKRRAEYLAGRYVAAQALAAVGRPGETVGTGAQREPLWPAGVTGSISHTRGRAVCAVTAKPGLVVGIDLEADMDAARARQIGQRIASASEEGTRPEDLSYADWLTAVFSGKEALYKALYLHVGRFFDFTAAAVTGIAEDGLTLVLTETLGEGLEAGSRFDLGLRRQDGHVLTWLVARFSA